MLIGGIYIALETLVWRKRFDWKDKRELRKTCDLITIQSCASKMHEQLMATNGGEMKIKLNSVGVNYSSKSTAQVLRWKLKPRFN